MKSQKHQQLNKSNFIPNISKLLLIFAIFLVVFPIIAQEKEENNKNWNFTVAPYIILPNMNGDVGMSGVVMDVSANPGDIFSNLDFGAMLALETSNDKWTLMFDLLYMDLSKEGTTPLLERKVKVDMAQLGITLNGLYKVTPWAEIGLGGRVNSVSSKLNIAPSEIILPGQKVSINETWFDPLIVTRVIKRFDGDKWNIGLLADIGGFGIGSDFSWQLNPFAGYLFSNLFELNASWRWLGMNYKTGSGTDAFLYDMVISGPQLGLLFHF